MIGTTVSHYKILEKLGEGGMGVVYKAEDTTLDRFVALKFLPASLQVGEQEKARFLQEAKAAAALNHPNICSVIAIDQADGHMFIVMEYVEGATLRERMHAMSLKQAIDIGIQLSDGLAAAHEKGIIHRDIKPENIMVRKDGIAQIMDFGLAKLRGSTKSKISRLTKEGSTIGTIGYMSPEQVQGQDVDHRSDIFSLGVLLYELMTGELPFKGVHETALLYEIVNVDAVPMSAVKPDIDPALDGVVLECLAKEPAERYQSVAEVGKELRRVKRESTRQRATRTMVTRQIPKGPETTPSTARRSILWPAVAAVLALALIVVAWGPWRKQGAVSTSVMRFPINLPLTAPLVGGAATLAIAPDGSKMVYLAESGGNQALFLRFMNQFAGQVIPGTDGALDPFFSPDGQWIGFFSSSKLWKVSVHGGAPVAVCDIGAFPRGGWWSPDDVIWFGTINQVIFRVPASGGTPTEASVMDTTHMEISHRFPQLLPDGKTLLYTVKLSNITSFDEALIATENVQTHERKVVVRGGSFARYVPTGHLMYARGRSIFAVPFDLPTLQVSGNPLPVIDGGRLNQLSGDANYGVANNGTLLYVPMGPVNDIDSRIVWLGRNGAVQPLIDTLKPYGFGNLSPDGQRLAMTIRAANDDIWVYHLGRKTLTRLTFGGGNSDLATWTPDGTRLLYASERQRVLKVFLKPWDGSGAEREVGHALNPDINSDFSVSPDGALAAFSRGGDLWTIPLEGDVAPTLLMTTPAGETQPRFSPDGKWLSYTSNESGRDEIYVMPFPKHDGKWQISSNGGNRSFWTAGGKELLYVEGRKIMRVGVLPGPVFDFTAPEKLADLPPTWNGILSYRPDGSQAIVGIFQSGQEVAAQVNVVVGWFEELTGKFSQPMN
jgi:serine/threonine-protein kinase